jgi:uncharacterized OB-fold protein
MDSEVLSAPYVLEYTYTRSTGPVIGRFLTGLRDRRIEGARTAAGKVIVPPLEYDPDTGEAVAGFVEVGQEGVVTTWSRPAGGALAWALVRLDGADTAMLHLVDGAVATGARVRARWRAERTGSIRDLECFEVIS